ncbi:MAG: response regulator, partial [Treponema sp.]|nr:response regulator [Treponema sp.]
MDFSFIKKEEIPPLKKRVADANSFRVAFFAPALTIYMLTELLTDWKKLLSPAYSVAIITFCTFRTNVYKIYVLLDALIVVSSLAVLLTALLYRKNPDRRQGLFLAFMRTYDVVLLTISFLAVVVTFYKFAHIDFTFFYMIALVCAGVFFSDALIFIPLCVGYFITIHVLISMYPYDIGYKPHVPYGIFLVVALCFISVFRAYHLLSTLRYEIQIEKFKDDAVRQNELKSKFLANMSHEIRTPMNAIVGLSELAQDFKLNPAQKNTIRQIRSSGIALVSIINDILDFSKIEAGKMEIVPSDYDILTLLYDVATICIVKLSGKDVAVRIQVQEDLPKILHGDDIRIKQVLVNLAGNAAKFTDTGSISIRAERIQDGKIKFSVSDTGVGIKKEDLEVIFAEFRQVDMSMNRTKGGTGLGLAISKNLVHLMGGSLDVASEYQKGSVFSFAIPQEAVSKETVGEAYLPIMREAEEDKNNPNTKSIDAKILNRSRFSGLFASGEFDPSHGADSAFTASKASILVVDDNLVNIQVAEGILDKFGIVPDTALSGFESLEKIAKKHYDIIFMDHQMPVMDGVETVKKIRESDGEQKYAVIIALSANAVNGAREMFIQNGFNDFVSKPVQIKDFARTLRKWLPDSLIHEKDVEQKADANADKEAHALSPKEEWSCPPNIIRTFVKLIDSSSLEIEDALAKNDLKNFTIKVHALKSSAKIVGAEEVSKLAAELEELGSKCNSQETLSLIQKKTEELLVLYKSCKQTFAQVIGDLENEDASSGAKSNATELTAQEAESFASKIEAACEQ